MKQSISRPILAIENDERHYDDVNRYIASNRDALNRSIKEGRANLMANGASGKSVEDIIRDGHLRF